MNPHRAAELNPYSAQISEFCRTFADNPVIGIVFDAKVREDYSRGPFRMDDQNRTHFHMLSAFDKAYVVSRSENSSGKCSSALPSTPSRKKKKVICFNWN